MKNRKKPAQIVCSQTDVITIYAALFATGLLFANLFPAGSFKGLFFAAIFFLAASAFASMQKYRFIILCMATLASAAFYGNIRMVPQAKYSHFTAFDKTQGMVTGTFKGEYKVLRSGGITFDIDNVLFTANAQTISIPGRVKLKTTDKEIIPEPEQTYCASGTFQAPTTPHQPPAFTSTAVQPLKQTGSPKQLAGKLQRKIRDGLNKVLPHRHAAIITGFILGDTSQINRDDRQLFRETGISHLLAVSGQHIMVLVVLLASILHLFRVPPVSRSILIAIFLVIYAMTTIGSPSIWRALIMYACIALVIHTEAFPSPARPVAIAAFILLLYDPATIGNAAFQLSFTAILSIIFLRAPFEYFFNKIYLPDFLSRYLAVTFAANFGTMPMTAFLFGTVSASALLVNPAILWAFSYILPVAFITAILSAFWPTLAIIIAPGLSLVLDGVIAILQAANSMPGGYFYAGNIPGAVIAAIYLAMLLVAARFNEWQISNVQKMTAKHAEKNAANNSQDKNGSNKQTAGNLRDNARLENRIENPFRQSKIINAIDAELQACRRRPLKNTEPGVIQLLPASLLSIESQNLNNQLLDLDQKTLAAEPERLLQAHIYLMALIGNEIINRISFHLNPPPTPGDLKIEHRVKDRNLAMALLADALLQSSLLTRATSNDFIFIISRVQTGYSRARQMLTQIMSGNNKTSDIEQHMILRNDLLICCADFIEFDSNRRCQQNTIMRPET